MKAIVKSKPGVGFELMDVETPSIKNATDVKLRVLKSSVCGTDLHIYKWDEWSQKTIKTPHVNGHEVLAEIVEVGDAVTEYKVGEVVACETHLYCGNCYQCRTGNLHVCANMEILGVNIDGIWCEYQVVPQGILWKIDGIDHKYAGIMEPLGNAIHTLSYSDLRGKHVLITGAGPIGVMAAYAAKVSGAATVTVSELNEYRKTMVKNMDLGTYIIDPSKEDVKARMLEITKGHGVDVGIEMSGNARALNTLIDVVIPAGEINVLSVYPTERVELDLNTLVFKNIKVQFVTGRRMFDTWNTASEWLKFGHLEPAKLDHVITHEFKMEDFEEVFKIMEEGLCGKIILDFTHLTK